MVVSRSNRIVSNNTQPCGICNDQLFKYICPRCNLRYCSLTCYKDKSHVQCTESFYKDSVMNEIQSNPTTIPHDRKNMLRILDRFEKQAIDQENMLDKSEDEILEQVYTQQQQQQQQLLQPQKNNQGSENDLKSDNTTTIATSKNTNATRKLSPSERNELIRKTIEQEQKEIFNNEQQHQLNDPDINSKDREELELALEQEHQDLISRFQGVNLDEESFESIWARLNPEEQREFQERFMLTKLPGEEEDGNEGYNLDTEDDATTAIKTTNPSEGIQNNTDDDEEELEARKLLLEMDETLQRGSEKYGKPDSSNPKLADLDIEDLRAIRDAEISELIQIWRPWWEIEAEQAGHLKKEEPSTSGKNGHSNNFKAGSIDNTTPKDTTQSAIIDRYMLDEEAMMRPHQSLIQDLDEIAREEKERQLMAKGVPQMARAPHPSLIYHICGLLFAYVATCRILNGDLKEAPEQTLAYIFDICPFFSPPPPAPTSENNRSTSKTDPIQQPNETQKIPEVEDFETTLAILQSSSLNSKLWKGDTLRLELLSLLLCDLTLLLAHPSRSLRSVQQLKEVFNSCIIPHPAASATTTTTTTSALHNGKSSDKMPSLDPQKMPRRKLFSKSTLHRLLKKLEFYESYLVSEEYFLKTNRLDLVRAEVVLTGMRIRQERVGWTRELEVVTKAKELGYENSKASEVHEATTGNPIKKTLIEEIP
ncbi:hypothetical protein BGZ76_003510 [Entomortierella beljakovae]|nr:hypothetical protein BGZ76_003510 [Entomortierella beljakovae]